MKIKLQEKIKGKWKNVDIKQLHKVALIDYFSDTFNPIVLGLYDEKDKLGVIITNNDNVIESYKEKDVFIIHSDDAMNYLSTRMHLGSVVDVFPNAGFLEIRKIEPIRE